MIHFELEGAVAVLSLDRGATRNALDRAGWRRLAEAIAAVAGSDARVLVLRSSVAGAFCAGSDLREMDVLAADEAARPAFRRLMRNAIDALPRLAIPVIAAIDGDCFGAGVALALGCDIRLAGAQARFAITPAKLGISYPVEDVERLVGAVGHGQAARLLFSAEAIPAAEAARIGLVEEACASAAARAEAMAVSIAANSAASVARLKAMIRERAAKAESNAEFDASFDSEDFAERLTDFRNRRKS